VAISFTLHIREINPHPGPHLDEVVAAVLARRYGGDKIVIAPDAKVVPCMLEGSETENLMEGRLPLGQLRGLFDDKDQNGERVLGVCCTTRMATFLGLRHRQQLQNLFNAVNRVDSTNTASRTDLSSFIKQMMDAVPSESHPGVFAWAEQGVNAIIDCLNLSVRPACTDYVKPLTVFNSMIQSGLIVDQQVKGRMIRLLINSEKQVENCLELSYVARAMKAAGVPDHVVVNWLEMGLGNYVAQMIQYSAAIEEVKVTKPYLIPRQPRAEVKGILIRSDNTQVAKASRGPDFQYALCIVRRSSGHVSIMVNEHDNLDMRGIWALIRLEETPVEKRAEATWEDYCLPGNHPNAPHWHMMKQGTALNGSNHIKVKKVTELSDEALIRITKIGLTDMARQRFELLVRLAQEKSPRARQRIPHRGPAEKAAPVIVTGVGQVNSAARTELTNVLDGSRKTSS